MEIRGSAELAEDAEPVEELRAATAAVRRSSRRLWLAGVIVAVAVGWLLWRGLGDATVYFRTADEAIEQRAELGDRRFRVEGVVVAGSVKELDGVVRFDIEENGATVPVTHRGDPPELFQPDIPVVLEGHWAGKRFASDRIMVKHSEEYRQDNPDRVDEYVGDGEGK
ncbi:MAG TPA: cytochrome c maturation protein CcmE [Acidimicrobiales bacterium]|nr:cytochrome c maturation protein CcmE [Acidimicrobiales bacterium]